MIDFDSLLERDTFIDKWCAHCGYTGILLATPRWYIACPKCLEARLRRVRETGVALPSWYAHVERVAGCNAREQAREALENPTVVFDDLYPCGGCGVLVLQRDARYHPDPVTHGSPPYCRKCYGERC